ncbi:MAG: hypothetical protein L3J72_03865 [Thermoplasmata archaeon]|nr:hypothetical protein [Thermoplasmata archaeon]
MRRGAREELERRAQDIDREHPDWNAREIERELESRASIAFSEWAQETQELTSRLRAVQRWRGAGVRGLEAKRAQLLFPYAWPVGERQRAELEPAYNPSSRPMTGSWRLFLYNCGPDVLHEIRMRIDGVDVGYAPFLGTARFTEVKWQSVEAIKRLLLEGVGDPKSSHSLLVEFVLAKGTRRGSLTGTLLLDAGQGWVGFDGGDGRLKEIE